MEDRPHLTLQELKNYTWESWNFPSPLYTRHSDSIPKRGVVVYVDGNLRDGGNGSFLLTSLLYPVLEPKYDVMEIDYDYIQNLTEKPDPVCPHHRLDMLLYSGYGHYRFINPIFVIEKFDSRRNMTIGYEIHPLMYGEEDICPADFAIFFASHCGFPSGVAYIYAKTHESYVFGFTTDIPIHSFLNEAIEILVRTYMETGDPELAYDVYILYFVAHAPEPDRFAIEESKEAVINRMAWYNGL